MTQRTRIKFCGVTRPQDADTAVALGVDAVGLVLAAGSPRFISLEQAAIIRRRLPAFVQAVALFRNADDAAVGRAIEVLQPDLLQFHGDESAAFCESFGRPYLRAVPMKGAVDLAPWERQFASAAALLLDAHGAGEPGGQGVPFGWDALRGRAHRPYVLAGGLTPDNVGAAVTLLRPHAVDVSSGIESAPGVKDEARMLRFIEAVRAADGH
jgi:phosphoribosylanthranilate isomerase